VAFTIDPTAVVIGAGQLYYRALSVATAWTNIGATMDDTVVRIPQTWFRPDLNGQLGPIQELDYLSEQNMELEATMMEVAGTNLALAIPGATSTTGTGAESGGAHGDSDLDGAVSAGATSIVVTAGTNFAVGDYIFIGSGATKEYMRLTAVSGTTLSFRDPLRYAHADAEVVKEAVDDNKVVVTGSTVRRMPSTQYRQWALVAEAPDGYYEFLLSSGISTTENAELSFGDDSAGGIRMTIAGRVAGATPTTPAWTVRVPQ
jgi:hypothetical protein